MTSLVHLIKLFITNILGLSPNKESINETVGKKETRKGKNDEQKNTFNQLKFGQ